MQTIHRLWPLTILVSGLLLAASDLPLPDTAMLVAPLLAAGLLLLIVRRNVPGFLHPWSVTAPPARRITIRIRCSR
jgi:hypothetical protein